MQFYSSSESTRLTPPWSRYHADDSATCSDNIFMEVQSAKWISKGELLKIVSTITMSIFKVCMNIRQMMMHELYSSSQSKCI
eukprot:scaffold229364_cov15-Prasinocladus_malaysianus.AAC.1